MVFLILLFYGLISSFRMGSSFWLAVWSNGEDRYLKDPINFTASSSCDRSNGTLV